MKHLALWIALALPIFAHADTRLKPGSMTVAEFSDQLSATLDISIDASTVQDQRVTVPDAGPLPPARLEALALTTLHLQGLTWIHDKATGMRRILRQRDARDMEIPLVREESKLPDTDELVTYWVQLKHTEAELVARNLRSFMPAYARIIPYAATNTVWLTDSAHAMHKLGALIARLDTPEVAKGARTALERFNNEFEPECPPEPGFAQGPSHALWIALFSLIAAVIGFLGRGYLIRRIEGGL